MGEYEGDCYTGVPHQFKDDFAPGLYSIRINGSASAKTLLCDTDGWTVFQSRGQHGKPWDDFYRDWATYKKGFGDPSKFKA